MKVSLLIKLTRNEIPVQDFLSELTTELSEYKRLIGKKGASIPIYVTGDTDFEFGVHELRALCKYFVDNKLSTEELSYLADAIDISSHIYVAEETIKEYVCEMTDPLINGVFTKERAVQILSETKI
jgi:hypothetical protein